MATLVRRFHSHVIALKPFLRGWHEFWQRGEEVFSIHLSTSPPIFSILHLHLSSSHLPQLHLTFLSTFHITTRPRAALPPSSVCFALFFLSQPFPSDIPLIFHFLTCFVDHLFLSLLCLSIPHCLPHPLNSPPSLFFDAFLAYSTIL